MKITNRQFAAYVFFPIYPHIALGITIDLKSPNISIHFLFGVFRIGWEGDNFYSKEDLSKLRSFGYRPKVN